ncbi:protein of unknown function [Enterobacter cancerogenus]|nr:protein of unknown function [Enterobacter cancerogenus]
MNKQKNNKPCLLYSLNRTGSPYEKSFIILFMYLYIIATLANANESYLTANAYIIILTTLLNVIMITLISAFRYQLSRNLQSTILPPQTAIHPPI